MVISELIVEIDRKSDGRRRHRENGAIISVEMGGSDRLRGGMMENANSKSEKSHRVLLIFCICYSQLLLNRSPIAGE